MQVPAPEIVELGKDLDLAFLGSHWRGNHSGRKMSATRPGVRPASKLSSRSFLFTAAARRARLPHPGGKWCRFFCHKIITQNEQKLFATEVIARLVGSILCNTNERGN